MSLRGAVKSGHPVTHGERSHVCVKEPLRFAAVRNDWAAITSILRANTLYVHMDTSDHSEGGCCCWRCGRGAPIVRPPDALRSAASASLSQLYPARQPHWLHPPSLLLSICPSLCVCSPSNLLRRPCQIRTWSKFTVHLLSFYSIQQ